MEIFWEWQSCITPKQISKFPDKYLKITSHNTLHRPTSQIHTTPHTDTHTADRESHLDTQTHSPTNSTHTTHWHSTHRHTPTAQHTPTHSHTHTQTNPYIVRFSFNATRAIPIFPPSKICSMIFLTETNGSVFLSKYKQYWTVNKGGKKGNEKR